MTPEQQNDLNTIRNGIDPSDMFEAAKHIIGYVDPELISELAKIAANQGSGHWARCVALYTLGFIDHRGTTEAVIRPIACDVSETGELRDYADEALYYFAANRHDGQHGSDDHYEGLGYGEWRDAQTDLAPEYENSTARWAEDQKLKGDDGE